MDDAISQSDRAHLARDYAYQTIKFCKQILTISPKSVFVKPLDAPLREQLRQKPWLGMLGDIVADAIGSRVNLAAGV